MKPKHDPPNPTHARAGEPPLGTSHDSGGDKLPAKIVPARHRCTGRSQTPLKAGNRVVRFFTLAALCGLGMAIALAAMRPMPAPEVAVEWRGLNQWVGALNAQMDGK
jgi:hypothetical protein